LAVHGKAARSALLQARELLVAEIPATWPLIEVAADGPGVANLRRAASLRGLHERGVQARDVGIRHEIGERDRGANAQASIGGFADGAIEVLDVDDPLRLRDVVLHQREEVTAAT